ncbi:ATP-binding protein [Halorhabdus amylolytica]|uniref:ATP-binding protein n=1 Tax=Halorhabdus amylolytica TaxID=2559573 RepID=UPI00145A1ED7|nr:ATP-binding protein [Halorhabdus amylolytica]
MSNQDIDTETDSQKSKSDSEQSLSHAREQWQEFLIERDVPSRTLGDVHGHSERVEKIKQTAIRSLTDPETPVRIQTLLFEGEDGAAPDQLARAALGTLSSEGFALREFPRRRRDLQRQDWRAFADALLDLAPVALYIGPEALKGADCARLSDALNTVANSNARVAILYSHIYEQGPGGHRRGRLLSAEAAELRVSVPLPDTERQREFIVAELNQLAERGSVTTRLTRDQVGEVLEQSATLTQSECEAITKRAAVLAQQVTEQPAHIEKRHLKAALEQVDSEGPDKENSRRHQRGVEEQFQPSVPEVTFDDIGGLDQTIERLDQLFGVHRHRDLFSPTTFTPAAGILLYGPPGTGKTRLAKALANERDRTFFVVEGAEVKTKWFGQSEKKLRKLFEHARTEAPSLIFFDEIDALARDRSTTSHSAVHSIVGTLLSELDGLTTDGDVVVIGATNRPEAVDPAVTRPGRLGTTLEISPPDANGLQSIFNIHTRDLEIATDVTPEWFSNVVDDHLTGAQIAATVERALQLALAEAPPTIETLPPITRSHFRTALEDLKNSDTEHPNAFA